MTTTYTTTYSLTHAKHLASKVIADLYLCSRQYGSPSMASIETYQEELITLLAGRYVGTYEFGFKRNEKRVLSWHYTAGSAGDLVSDSRSGGLIRGVDIAGAAYFNFLTYSAAWLKLSPSEQENIEATLPIQRTFGSAPGDGQGRWITERTYAAGGEMLERRLFWAW